MINKLVWHCNLEFICILYLVSCIFNYYIFDISMQGLFTLDNSGRLVTGVMLMMIGKNPSIFIF